MSGISHHDRLMWVTFTLSPPSPFGNFGTTTSCAMCCTTCLSSPGYVWQHRGDL